MNHFFDTVLRQAKDNQNIHETDYKQDGIFFCGECHSPKEYVLTIGSQTTIVPVVCNCQQAKQRAERVLWNEQQRDALVRQLRSNGISDRRYSSFSFRNDNGENQKVSAVCKNFVKNFSEIQKNKAGLLFFGEVGTGKTFFACCIANALIEQGIPVAITNFATLIGQLQNLDEQHTVIPKLCRKKLVVLDDLGAQRDTSYGNEQVFSVVDSLVRSDTVVIITSNLSPKTMDSSVDLANKRIYDRVLNDLCPVHIPVLGESYRKKTRAEKVEKAMTLLSG